jgi:Recombinase
MPSSKGTTRCPREPAHPLRSSCVSVWRQSAHTLASARVNATCRSPCGRCRTSHGYDLADDRQRVTPNAAEQAILAVIQASRATGESYALIADSLNADRVPTKHGGRWYAATVRSVLNTAARWAGAAASPPTPTGASADGTSSTGRLPKRGDIRVDRARGVRSPERRRPHAP